MSHPDLEMGHPRFLHNTHTKHIWQPIDGRGPLTFRVLTNGAYHQAGGNTGGSFKQNRWEQTWDSFEALAHPVLADVAFADELFLHLS